MKIGFIGLGIMGSRMAQQLLQAGYEMVVYNRSEEKTEPLKEVGAQTAASPAEVAKNTDILITMLANPEAVEVSAFGENGFLEVMNENMLWVDCSTVNPSFTQKMVESVKARNLRMVDAPVAGSKIPAERGELVFLVGGSDGDVAFVQPILEDMGKAINHVGTHGQGSAMKMVINLLLGQSMAAFSEAMRFGEALGIHQDQLLQSLLGGPVTAPFLQAKKNHIQEANYEVEFPLKWMRKDLHLVAQSAYEANVPLVATNTVKEVYAGANQAGWGDLDFSAIYQYLKANSIESNQ